MGQPTVACCEAAGQKQESQRLRIFCGIAIVLFTKETFATFENKQVSETDRTDI